MLAVAVMLILAVCAPRLASAGGAACPGDCDGSGLVAINELLVGVNIALSKAPISMCPAFDQDGSDTVSVGELIRAVNVALSGNCGTNATPTPTAVVTAPTLTPAPVTSTPTATGSFAPTRTATFGPTRTATPVPTIVTLYVGSASGQPGSSVTIDVTLATAGQSVAGTLIDIQFDARARVRSNSQGRPNCSSTVEDRYVRTAFLPVGCDPATTCQRARVIVMNFAAPALSPLQDGEVLYSCEVDIAAGAGAPDVSLGCANPQSGSTVPITRLTTGCVGGEVTIGSQGAAAGSPSDVCWGDCRGLGYPTFDDFQSIVAIALGAPLATCPEADTDADLLVDIFDVLRVAQTMLLSCLSPSP